MHNSSNFNEFLNRTNEKEIFVNTLVKIIDLNEIKSILSVGASDGTLDLMIKKNCSQLIDYDVIEPKIIFKQVLSENFTNVYLTDLEHFEFERHYDLIILSHVLYYIENLEEQIERIIKKANRIIIYIQTKETFTYEIQKLLDNSKKLICSDDIKHLLDKMKIKYMSITSNCNLNIKNINDNIIRFISDNKLIKNEEIKMVKEYLENNSSGYILNYPNEIIII